jgi:UDP-4-amino-4,6-dideoxy-N-acetyl-beta-L-altrosamine N-acetyltransferase
MKAPSSSFRILTADLIEKVRGWRNQPRISRNMISDAQITREQQKKWFEGLANDSTRKYMVFFQDETPIGLLYFSSITRESCEWGCYIGEEAVWPGSGLLLEVAALDYAFNTLEVNRLIAEVFEFNVAPQRMHDFFGYQNLGLGDQVVERDGVEYGLIRYWYEKGDWLAKREQVISKLPGQIKTAVEKISFESWNRKD